MAFIHERPDWPAFRWRGEELATPLAAARCRQGTLLGRLGGLGLDLRSDAHLTVLTGEVVKSSAIEGEALDAGEVRSSIARQLGLDASGLPAPSRDVDGVVEMMLDATQRFAMPLTAERLCRWHATLFPGRRSGVRRITVGAWRPASVGPMQVVSGPIGRERVHFEAPAADRLDKEMARFLAWFDAPSEADPVLHAAIAHLWFVTLHPFEDGNGRIGRAIGEMALCRADGAAERYYSLSSQIEAERKAYYRELEATQRGDLDITRWLSWFVGCFDRAIGAAGSTLASVLHKAAIWQRVSDRPVNARQRKVISRMLDGFEGFLTNAKYTKIAQCSPDTALRDIRDLVERGVLIRNPASGRSTSYRLAQPDAASSGLELP